MRYTLSLFLLLTISVCYSQEKYADSILNLISKAPAKEHAALYNQLSSYYYVKDYDLSSDYAHNALEVALAQKQYVEVSDAYCHIANVYHRKGLTDEAIKVIDSALIYAKKSGNKPAEFEAHVYYSNLLRRKADYNNALYHGIQAVKISEELNDTKLQANGYHALAVVYVTMNDFKKAEEHYLKSASCYLKAGDTLGWSRIINNIGIIYRDHQQYAKAIEYYKQSLEIALKANSTADIAFLYNDIGAAYSFMGNYNKAEEYLKKSIAMREQMKEYDEIAYTYNYLGENYERQGRLKLGEQYIKKALATAIQIGNNKQHYEALESLSDFYSRNKMYDSAYNYLKQYQTYRDSLSHMENKRYIAELTTQYETEKKEQQIKLQETELSRKNYVIVGISGLLLLGVLLALSSYNRYRLKQNDKLQKAIIQQQISNTSCNRS